MACSLQLFGLDAPLLTELPPTGKARQMLPWEPLLANIASTGIEPQETSKHENRSMR